jgi:hypothetical protein
MTIYYTEKFHICLYSIEIRKEFCEGEWSLNLISRSLKISDERAFLSLYPRFLKRNVTSRRSTCIVNAVGLNCLIWVRGSTPVNIVIMRINKPIIGLSIRGCLKAYNGTVICTR